MGFFKPELPQIDMTEWSKGTRSEKIRPMARHWAEVGFGTPVALHLFYVVKIGLYILGGGLFAVTTAGLGGLAGITTVGSWWSEPIVFEKVVLYTMLFEVVGLGCGFGPLNNRFFPPMGSILYWLRPDTIRLPPWPDRIPLTKGTARTPVDVALYAALLTMLLLSLFSDGTGPVPALHTDIGLLPVWQVWVILGLLTVLGLRDKVIFLAARGEVYASLAVTFLFPAVDMIVASKVVFVVIWMGAATSKLNHHFPFVISTMMSNNPLIRAKSMKRAFFESFPDDLRPGRLSRIVAHGGTTVEMCVPVVLFFAHGGWLTAVAAAVMVCFHLAILTAIPMGVPLEWNVFMIYGIGALFVAYADLGLADLKHPVPVAILFAVLAGIVIAGNLFPRKISFLPGMRYYAGNWDTTLWCVKPSADEKISRGLVAIASMPAAQLERFYGKDRAQIPMYLGYAFRAMNTHGRALFTLAHRAMAGQNEDDYVITDGERICSTAIGWNFGDGHMHNEQLITAMQERCHFEPGEVRVVLLDAQPIHRQTQEYRLVDAATGEFERGYVQVADMVTRQPWDDTVPVHVYEHQGLDSRRA
ncbi:DUF3556 domain-containing protein [Mycobacterium xenopi]|uniref:Transmembrane protein n=1 Tax=Mycobacterium xenopi TaxID=1789 RepID=A0AAD1H1F2_MYCXE|nr:DUF3556 domain-containing protein [Mycobacterium xenopi]EUA50421.1 hypothetical protein I552_1357 [Mycobacterium xenopi 3993]EID14862.1 hypothetical protein MXEN_08397 [Mycobacterium xenopi RIVM700367]MDA3641575.1 DUF3556 domain-containing protein [Mycobacterium xenopi]MDA3657118.1 DUF3556 domain-containing protein [Mycobacterium xenopi]MDA3663802.1 DUF3556 domain-containing protein [Mycobacterium xenopi]